MQTLKMDFQSQSAPPVVPVMQSDSQSRFIGITLYNGGAPYEAPEGASYTVQYRGPGANNMGWYDTITLSSGTRKAVIVDSASKNVVTLELAEQALRVNGNVFVNLCVVTNTGYMLKTFPILCRVTAAAFPDTVAVQSFFYVTGITSEQWLAYVTACQDAQKRAEDAAATFETDPTLSVEGKAADAGMVGKKNILGKNIFNSENVPSAPYRNLNTVPKNEINTYIGINDYLTNIPTGVEDVFTLLCYSTDKNQYGGSVQVVTDSQHQFFRYAKTETEYSNWNFLNGNLQMNGKVLNNTFETPYDDLDTVPVNSVCTYIGAQEIRNKPLGAGSVFTVLSINYHNTSLGGTVQIVFDEDNVYKRIALTESDYKPWSGCSNNVGFELLTDCGVIGDSYASGATDKNGIVTDHIDISWPQICGRLYGCKFENFSFGGATTQSWLTSDSGLKKLNSSEKKTCYIIALGINDNAILGKDYLGTIDDMHDDADTNPNTFFGNYGKIISAINKKSANAKIVILNINQFAPGDNVKLYNGAVEEISKKCEIPIMHQENHPHLTSEQYISNIVNNHPTPAEYNRMAIAFNELFGMCVTKYVDYFNDYSGEN